MAICNKRSHTVTQTSYRKHINVIFGFACIRKIFLINNSVDVNFTTLEYAYIFIQIGHKLNRLVTIRPSFHILPC